MRYKAALIAILLAGPAFAHNAPSGVQYLPECCSQRDCAPVPDRMVHELGGGAYGVRVPPGSHPMWPADKGAALYVEFSGPQVKPPLDGEWHICLSPTGAPLCIHPPMRSF